MATARQRYWIASTGFADVEPLLRSVGSLIDAGIDLDEVCIYGPAAHMTRVVEGVGETGRHEEALRAFLSSVRETTLPSSGEEPVVATASRLLTIYLRALAAGMDVRHRKPAIESHDSGRLNLLVGADDAREQIVRARILLADGDRVVATHAFMLPVLHA